MCAYLDVNVNLVTVAVQPTGGEDILKGKEYIFWGDFFFSLISTNSLVGRALSLIAAVTVVLRLAVSVNTILGPKGQIPGSCG